jgi:hypothetical protein
MLNQDQTSKQLYDLLLSRNLQADTLTADGRPPEDPGDAKVFKFDFVASSGKNYGTVVILMDFNAIAIYYSDNIGRGFVEKDKKQWFDLLQQLKQFAVRHFMTFDVRNVNRMKFDLKKRSALRESLTESWVGNRTTSYYGNPQQARLMIKHTRPLGEADARYRLIDKLFIETADGERFKLPFASLTGGRAMVEHVRNGGTPYDIRGQHISSLVEELNTLRRFTRASKNKIFENENTSGLVEQATLYYESLKKTAKRIATPQGYNNYFENWQPLEITNGDIIVEHLREMFVTQSIDERIDQALPILARIQQETAMKEVEMFESWTNSLTEGCWALPKTREQQKKFLDLMAEPLMAGPDGVNATRQLDDVFGDDSLFDAIEDVATVNPDTDVRSVVINHMTRYDNDHNPEIEALLSQINLQGSESPDMAPDMEMPPQMDDTDVGPELTGQEDGVDVEEPPMAEGKSVAKTSKYKYDRDLDQILKHAGVKDPTDPQKADDKAAVNYEVSSYDRLDESVMADIVTDIQEMCERGLEVEEIADSLKIPVSFVNQVVSDYNELDENCGHCGHEDEMEEGAAGSALGGMAGKALGAAMGPVGSLVGGAIGSYAGDKIGDKLSERGGTTPVHDPELVRLKTLAGFTMVK